MEEKRCYKCGKVKKLSKFYKNKSKKDGHTEACKYCKRLEASKYRLEHIEEIRLKNRIYERINRKKALERHKRWKKLNYKHSREADRKWQKRACLKITDSYIRRLLGSCITPEQIELKRQQIIALRILKEFKKIKESINESDRGNVPGEQPAHEINHGQGPQIQHGGARGSAEGI